MDGGTWRQYRAESEPAEQGERAGDRVLAVIRGSAVNQVQGARTALVTGGPASLPVSATILTR